MSKENKAILKGNIYYMHGNYKQIFDAFSSDTFKIGDFYQPTENQASLSSAIARDIDLGNPFLVQDENEFKSLQARWNATKLEDMRSFAQGDGFGSLIAKLIIQDLRYPFVKRDKVDKFFGSIKHISFGYLDDDNTLSGISIYYSTDAKEPCWAISILNNPTSSPEERRLHVFTNLSAGIDVTMCNAEKLSALDPVKATNKKFFKPFNAVSFNETLKKALNSEKVYLLLENMLNSNGTMKTDYLDEKNLGKRGYKTEGMMITHPPVPKKPEDTVTPSATPINPKPNANVTSFIQKPKIATEINTAIANRNFTLSEDRHFLVNKKDGRKIHLGLQGQKTTDPINTAKTPDPKQTTLDILIVMLRTDAIIFLEGGEDNFPAEKMALKFTQKAGASETQKQNFMLLEANLRKALAMEIETNPTIYTEAFLKKVSFNGLPLEANPKKRPADAIAEDTKGKAELDETDEAYRKRIKSGP